MGKDGDAVLLAILQKAGVDTPVDQITTNLVRDDLVLGHCLQRTLEIA